MREYSSKGTAEIKPEKYVKEYVENILIGYEYVGGYTGCDGYVRVRCKKCGTITTKSMVSIRHYGNGTVSGTRLTICYGCRNKKKKLKALKTRLERLSSRINKLKKRVDKQIELNKNYEKPRYCMNCGEIFYDYSNRTILYCSKHCANRFHDRAKENSRRKKIVARPHDTDITIEKLYSRDKGKCYICGMQCNWNDYVVDSQGNTIVGAWYPSIEHIVPIASGGCHQWNNVKLAHKHCNEIKGIKEAI